MIFEKPYATGHSGFGIPTRSPTEISGKMARSKCLLLGVLLFSCLHLPALGQDDEIEDIEVVEEEKAFLIVRKNVVDREKVVVGKAITVEIEIHNAGTRYTIWPGPSDQGKQPAQSLTGIHRACQKTRILSSLAHGKTFLSQI